MKKILSSVLAALLLFSAAAALSGCDTRNITPCDHYKMARDGFRDALGRGVFGVLPDASGATGFDLVSALSQDGEERLRFGLSAAFEDPKYTVDGQIASGDDKLTFRMEGDGERDYFRAPADNVEYLFRETENDGGEKESVGKLIESYVIPENIAFADETVSVMGSDVSARRYTLSLDGDAVDKIAGRIGKTVNSLFDSKTSPEDADGPVAGTDIDVRDLIDDFADRMKDAVAEASFWQKNGATVKGAYVLKGDKETLTVVADVESTPEKCVIDGYLSGERDGEELIKIPFRRETTEKDGKFEERFSLAFSKMALFDDDETAADVGTRMLKGASFEFTVSGEYGDSEASLSGDIAVAFAGGDVEITFPFKIKSVKNDDGDLAVTASAELPGGLSVEYEGKSGKRALDPGKYDPESGISNEDGESFAKYWENYMAQVPFFFGSPEPGPEENAAEILELVGNRRILRFYGNGEGDDVVVTDVVREGDEFSFTVGGDVVSLTLTADTDSITRGGERFDVYSYAEDGYFDVVGESGTEYSIYDDGETVVSTVTLPFRYEMTGDGIVFSYPGKLPFTLGYEVDGSVVTLGGERFSKSFVDRGVPSFYLYPVTMNTWTTAMFYPDMTGFASTADVKIKEKDGSFKVLIDGETVLIEKGAESVAVGGAPFSVYAVGADLYSVIAVSDEDVNGIPVEVLYIYCGDDKPGAMLTRSFTYREEGDGYIVTMPDGDEIAVTKGDRDFWYVDGAAYLYRGGLGY
ncbi:MAG: hypothetical protein IJS78_01350 [Clostridia bacterium]|nr:hypothetical protein [Clostridia bacterium]